MDIVSPIRIIRAHLDEERNENELLAPDSLNCRFYLLAIILSEKILFCPDLFDNDEFTLDLAINFHLCPVYE